MKDLQGIQRTLRATTSVLRDKYKVRRIGVFGSFVRGEQREGSDLDVLVEFGEAVSLLDLVGLEIYLSDLLEMKVDVVPEEDIRPELKEQILSETAYI